MEVPHCMSGMCNIAPQFSLVPSGILLLPLPCCADVIHQSGVFSLFTKILLEYEFTGIPVEITLEKMGTASAVTNRIGLREGFDGPGANEALKSKAS